MKIDKEFVDKLEKRAADKNILHKRVIAGYDHPERMPPEYRDEIVVSTADVILLIGALRAAGAVKDEK